MILVFSWWLHVTHLRAEDTPKKRPACTAQALSGTCEFFRRQRHRRLIQVGDGTAYINPAFEPPTQVSVPEAKAASPNARELDTARAEADLQRAWRTARGVRVSDVFKAAFTRVVTSPAAMAGLGASPESEPAPVILPWPPQSEDASPRSVSPTELAGFLGRLPAATRRALGQGAQALNALGAAGDGDGEGEASEEDAMPARVTPERERRIEELTEFARQGLLSQILPEGRTYASLSPAEKSQYDRVRTVHVTPMSLAAADPECAKAEPTALYNPEKHTFVICPNAALQPDAFLVHVIAHEISHSVDGCGIQYPLVEVDRARLKSLDPRTPPDEVRTNPERFALLQTLLEVPPETKYAQPRLSVYADPDVMTYFVNKGYVRQVAATVPTDQDPRRDVAKCLMDNGVRGVGRAEIERRVDAFVHQRVRRAAVPIDAATLRKNALASALRYPGCMGGDKGDTRLNEAGADVMATPVTASWLKLHPPRTEAQRMALIGPMLSGEVCGPRAAEENLSVSANEVMAVTSVDKVADGHPGEIARANEILLNDPGVQAAFDCEPVPGKRPCSRVPQRPGSPTPTSPAQSTEISR